MFRRAKRKWQHFWTNFSWDKWVPYINGPIPKLAFLVPVVGYLVIFNDTIAENIDFKKVTASDDTSFFLGSGDRLKYIYFGLIALAVNSAYYYWRRPLVVRQGDTSAKYVDFALTNFVVQTFTSLHHNIGEYGNNSHYGRYYTDDWEAFLDDARWYDSGRSTASNSIVAKRESRKNVNFSKAKDTHEDLLRSILLDTYIGGASKNKIALCACIGWATLGYLLLLIPSFDLFLRVIETTIT